MYYAILKMRALCIYVTTPFTMEHKSTFTLRALQHPQDKTWWGLHEPQCLWYLMELHAAGENVTHVTVYYVPLNLANIPTPSDWFSSPGGC